LGGTKKKDVDRLFQIRRIRFPAKPPTATNFDRDFMYEMAKHIFDRSFRPALFSDFCDQPIWAFDSVAGLKFLTAQVVRLVRL
jgi:hypothetical protein